jgi:hypothetical protein
MLLRFALEVGDLLCLLVCLLLGAIQLLLPLALALLAFALGRSEASSVRSPPAGTPDRPGPNADQSPPMPSLGSTSRP